MSSSSRFPAWESYCQAGRLLQTVAPEYAGEVSGKGFSEKRGIESVLDGHKLKEFEVANIAGKLKASETEIDNLWNT